MSEFSNNEVSRGGNSLSIDPIVLETAEQVLSGIGISMSSYIEMCLRQVAQSATVPLSPLDDPEFWMAERAIRAVYHKYETGEYHAAKKLIEEISEELNTRYMNFAMHLIGSQPTGNTNQLPALMMLEEQYISQLDTMDIADLEDRLKSISKIARSSIIANVQTAESDEGNETIDTLEMIASFFDSLVRVPSTFILSIMMLRFRLAISMRLFPTTTSSPTSTKYTTARLIVQNAGSSNLNAISYIETASTRCGN